MRQTKKVSKRAIHVNFTTGVLKALKARARGEGRSVSETIERMIRPDLGLAT